VGADVANGEWLAFPSHHFVGGSTAARPLLKLTSDATDYRLVVDDRVTV
jgi:hypothetical protein